MDKKPLSKIPSQRAAEIEKRRIEAQQEYEEQRRTLVQCAENVAATPEGQVLLRHIAKICGVGKVKSTLRYERASDGSLVLVDVSPNATIHLAARESVWLELRGLLQSTTINKVENEK